MQCFNICLVPAGGLGSGPVTQLAAKAQHHSTSIQRMEGHLDKQGSDTDHTERCVFANASLLILSMCC